MEKLRVVTYLCHEVDRGRTLEDIILGVVKPLGWVRT